MIQGSHPGTDDSHPPQVVSYSISIGIITWAVQQPGNEHDHSLPTTAEVNGWSYTSTPPMCCHGMNRDNFFTITLQLLLY